MEIKKYGAAVRTMICALTLMLAAFGAGCSPAARSEENENAGVSEKTRNESADSPGAGGGKSELQNASADFSGRYRYKTKGRNHYENILEVKNAGASQINVYYEGVYIYQVGDTKDDTMKEDGADGILTLKGNTATGYLTREGEKQGCRVILIFAGESVTLKSADCDMNVAPDGVYTKESGTPAKSEPKSEEPVEKNPSKADDVDKIYVQYGDDGAANAILNMMGGDGDRVGCENAFNSFEGSVAAVKRSSPDGYEFTLAAENGKRRAFHAWVGEDVSAADAETVIAPGARLVVNYILCGNAGHPTPVEIFRQ